MIKECIHCDIEFDVNTPLKRAVGGKINECPDCVEELGTEIAIRHRGVNSEDNEVHIMSFESKEDLKRFNRTKEKESSRLE